MTCPTLERLARVPAAPLCTKRVHKYPCDTPARISTLLQLKAMEYFDQNVVCIMAFRIDA